MDLIPAEEGGDDYYLNDSYTKLKDAGSAYGLCQMTETEKLDADEPEEEQLPDPDEGEDEEEDTGDSKNHAQRHAQRKAQRRGGKRR